MTYVPILLPATLYYPLVPWAELRRRVGLLKVSTAVPREEKYRHTDAQTLAFVCLCEMFFTPKLSVIGLCARDILYDHLLLSEGFVLANLISAMKAIICQID